MGCQIHTSHPQILFKIPINKPKLQSRTLALSLSSFSNQEPLISISTTLQEQNRKSDVYSVKFKTLGDCKLGISRYPDFEYNAKGGEGSGIGKTMVGVDFNGETSVDFDVKTLYIPSLSTATTKFLGLPLPPFLKIEIVPEIFRGIINMESGKVEFEPLPNYLLFHSCFSGSENQNGWVGQWVKIDNGSAGLMPIINSLVGSIYKAPPLMVETLLTSEESKGNQRSGTGQRLDEQGRCKLVGVATVEQIDDFLMNSFLDLPNECLAILNATIIFSKD